MAPQQDLERLVDLGGNSHLDGGDTGHTPPRHDEADVIVVSGPRSGDRGKEKNKKGSSEKPQNCPHLETALFYFGIAGMIVSLIMLIFHLLRNVTYY